MASPVAAHFAWEDEPTAVEIRSTIIGNTLAGQYEGKKYVEYYNPDGTIRGATADGPYTGQWSIRADDLMCFAYEPDYVIVGCVLLFLDGDTVSFNLVDGTDEPPAKPKAGNPEGL